MGMLAGHVDHVIGVDTHRDTHSAAILEPTGAAVHAMRVRAEAKGYRRILAEAAQHAPGRRVWAIEGSGGYGAGLSTYLQEQGEWVVEIDRPARPARRNGAKSDELDAVRAAREALARDQLAGPRARGEREALRVLLITRQGAIRARTAAIAQVRALVLTAEEGLRGRLRGLRSAALLRRCASLRTHPAHGPERRATLTCLRSAARRALALEDEAVVLKDQMAGLVALLAPGLLGQCGVGVISASQVLVAFSHPGRIRSEAAFAALGGVAPIPASSGQVVRHRLNRGGDRQLNRGLHTIVKARLRCDERTQHYAAKRTSEGKSAPEIRRCLKRYVARQLFRLLEAGGGPATPVA